MGTIALTAETFESTVSHDGILVFSQPGALPAPVFSDLIGQVRALDMDEVRATVAQTASP